MYILIDSGTTNTRVALINGKKIIQKIKINAGARDTAVTGSTDKLKGELKNAFSRILKENSLKAGDIKRVIASGMIVSEAGLCLIPHVTAPATAKKLKENAKTVVLSEITELPITFIPGVKNNCNYSDISDISDMDVMRGEETEALGIFALSEITEPMLAVLPGSHTKTVNISERGEIISCRTTLGGEMIKAISENTILKGSFGENLPQEFSEEYLFSGYEFAKKYGLNSALFKVRLLKMFLNVSDVQAYSFFTGAVLESDIRMIKDDADKNSAKIAVGGSNPLKSVFFALIKKYVNQNVIKLSDELCELCTFAGGIYITEGKDAL